MFPQLTVNSSQPIWLQILLTIFGCLAILLVLLHFNLSKPKRRLVRGIFNQLFRHVRDKPIQIIDSSAKRIHLILNAVYGNIPSIKFISISFFITFALTFFILSVGYINIFTDQDEIIAQKEQIEYNSDPWLWDNQELLTYALESKVYHSESIGPVYIPIHKDSNSEKIRKRFKEYPLKVLKKLTTSEHGGYVGYSIMFHGLELQNKQSIPPYNDPKIGISILFFLNIIIDIVSLYITSSILITIIKSEKIYIKTALLLVDSISALLLFCFLIITYNPIILGFGIWIFVIVLMLLFLLGCVLSFFSTLIITILGINFLLKKYIYKSISDRLELVRQNFEAHFGIENKPFNGILYAISLLFFLYLLSNSGFVFVAIKENAYILSIFEIPKIQYDGKFNFIPYLLGISAMLPTAMVIFLAFQGFLIHYLAVVFRPPTIIYMRAISRMNKPIIILIGSSLLMFGSLIAAIQSIFSSLR